jgi:hypothetical protein
MKVEFCYADGGHVKIIKDSEEIKDILNIVTKEGSKVYIFNQQHEDLYGYVSEVLYQIDQDTGESFLSVYISERFEDTMQGRILNKLSNIEKKIGELS